MFRKTLVFLVVLVAMMALLVSPAQAVKFGEPDNGEHPYVGLIVFYTEDGTPQWRCTGTLISPTVMLTAGHCAELNGPATVWFAEDLTSAPGYPFYGGGDSVTGRSYTYPVWQGGLYLPNTGDAGVVVLDEPVVLPYYPSLAPVNSLDDLATQRGLKDVNFKVVGYGLQSVKPKESALRIRMKAYVQLVNLRSALTDGYNLHTTNNPGNGTGPGGTCFGDSGGAIFNSSNQIVAVNSFVLNSNCNGASFGYRIDKSDVQAWVLSFLE